MKESLPHGIFITGTDTGVGKTVITAALAWTLKRAGRDVAALKPVQTGTEQSGPTDIDFVQNVLGTKYGIDDVCPYRFPKPLAPLVASEIAGEKIDTRKIRKACDRLESVHDIVLVEGAGGLLVPILEDYLMSDLASDLDLPLLIVVRPGLGTLNHTLLTVESARARGLEVLGIVINNFPQDPGIAERTNPGLITAMSGVPLLGVYPSDPALSVEKNNPGNIRETAPSALAPLFGGTFNKTEFLSGLS
ncbi:MAG: dethiobiotin synthase [Deltaproteobacteria bacterium]